MKASWHRPLKIATGFGNIKIRYFPPESLLLQELRALREARAPRRHKGSGQSTGLR